MAERKTPNKGYQKLKSDLSTGNIGQVYIFYGEESYLREYYLGEIKKKLVPAGFEEFNYHRLSGKTLTMQELNEAVEAMPMMAERTLIVVTDCDLFKLPEEQRTALIALLNDFPPYCCLVFVYDLVEYKPSKTYKKLYEALDKNAQSVKFEAQERSDLINWIARRFRALGKGIDAQTAEHLIFTCGALMTGLVPEIEKIGAYAKGKNITTDDINAVADPVLDAVVFGSAAQKAGGAVCHSGRYQQGAAAHLHRAHRARQRQGQTLAHGAVGDAVGLSRALTDGGGAQDDERVVQPEPSHVSAARPAHEERKRYRQRGRAQAAADAPCTGEVNLWQSRR